MEQRKIDSLKSEDNLYFYRSLRRDYSRRTLRSIIYQDVSSAIHGAPYEQIAEVTEEIIELL